MTAPTVGPSLFTSGAARTANFDSLGLTLRALVTRFFSGNVLVPYDKWVQVGFVLSSSRNSISLFISSSMIVDTQTGLGQYVCAGKVAPISGASIRTRILSTKSPGLFIGGHRPQPGDSQFIHSHLFLGFIGDVRWLQVAPESADAARQVFRQSNSELVAAGLTTEETLCMRLEVAPAEKAPFPVRQQVFASGDMVADSYADQPRHPLLGTGDAVQGDAPSTPTGPPGPTLSPEELAKTWPKEWTDRFSSQELLKSQRDADPWADKVRDAMRHSWSGYHQRAWGHDDIKPISGQPKDWCKLAITMLDSLTTLWLMGLHQEFDDAQRWIEEHPMPSPGKHGPNSLFEIMIRAVGGLLGAYSLSGRAVFLDNAKRIADKMLPAFETKSGMPKSAIDVGTGAATYHSWMRNNVLAEVTTVQLELRYLTHVTGEKKYQEVADRAMETVLKAAGTKGIVPIYLVKDSPAFSGKKISFGAMGDSYYEYLLKQWLQTGKTEHRFKDKWKDAMKEMQARLIHKTAGGITYIAEEDNGRVRKRMDHLACFVSGMLVLGARTLPEEEVDASWEGLGHEIARTCYEMYHRAPTGLSPEYIAFIDNTKQDDMQIPKDAPHNLLRPEAAEAIYYMHYYTGDPQYREWAKEMFDAFLKHSKTKYGFSAVADVRKQKPSLRDGQESFWLGETLKYFYLIFAPRSTLSLEEYVLNTEAHPLKMWSTG